MPTLPHINLRTILVPSKPHGSEMEIDRDFVTAIPLYFEVRIWSWILYWISLQQWTWNSVQNSLLRGWYEILILRNLAYNRSQKWPINNLLFFVANVHGLIWRHWSLSSTSNFFLSFFSIKRRSLEAGMIQQCSYQMSLLRLGQKSAFFTLLRLTPLICSFYEWRDCIRVTTEVIGHRQKLISFWQKKRKEKKVWMYHL